MTTIFLRALSIPFFMLIASNLTAQKWVEMMQDPEANFYDTQAAAEQYFETHPTGKGSGWKVYKRWEYYMEQHIGADGKQNAIVNVEDEMEKYYQLHPESLEKRNSTNGTWRELGPITMPTNGTGQPNGLGRINCIAYHPTDANTVYVGAPNGGFWRTADYGVTWEERSVGMSYLGVSAIVSDPGNPNLIYIGTGDRDGGDAPGRGVWYSTDGGLTWASRNNGMGNRTVNDLIMHPTNSSIMVAFTANRIYRTTNGGANWTQTFTGHNCKDADIHPTDPNIMYAAGSRVYRSTDNGQSWSQVTSGILTASRYAIATSPDEPNYVYLLGGNGSGLVGVLRSTDSGQNFTTRATTPNVFGYGTTGGTGSQAWYDNVLIADPNDADIIYTGGVNIWKSIDGGSNFTLSAHWTGSGGADDVHADHHAFAWSPHTGHLWNGNDGGVYITSDGGVVWNEFSSGLGIAQIYKIGQSQTDGSLVINGYQDNGTAFTRGGNWFTEIGGDGMECIVDYTDASVMYGALYYGDMRRSTNNGATFSTIAENGTNGINESGSWVTPYKLHPTDANTMFIGYRNVWRSNNVKTAATNAVTWTRISNFGSSTCRDLAISPSNPDRMYVITGASSANLYRSNNANAGSPTWTNLDGSLPAGGTPRDLEIDPADPDHIWLALGNDIYESSDAGNSWTNFSGTLPNIALFTIVYDTASTNDALYVGMDVGVYYRDNSLTDWIPFSTGLPNTEVTELEIYYDSECRGSDLLRAATYGRGLWESDLRDPGTVAPAACFEASDTNVCVGATVTLIDNSAYTPTSWNWTITPATFAYVNATSATSQNPQVRFATTGFYTITMNATNAFGADSETRTSYINVSGSAMTLPFSEDFESMATCATASDCGTTVCGLNNGWENLSNGSEDDIDWRIDEGGTPSTTTGPSVDFNPGTATGNYAYLEASSCFSRTALMVSPCIDLTSASGPELEFAWHLFGSNMGELHVDVLSGGAWNLDVMTALTGDQGNAWQSSIVSLNSFVGEVVKVRFRGITGNGFRSDMAIDDIVIRETGPFDASNLLSMTGRYREGQGNQLNWELIESEGLQQLVLQKEEAGSWVDLETYQIDNNKSRFEYMDQQAAYGINQYRIMSLTVQGDMVEAARVQVLSLYGEEYFWIYPRPVQDILNIDIQAKDVRAEKISIYNLTGQEVLAKPIILSEGSNHFEMDLSFLKSGVYIVHYGNHSVKLIKL